MSPLTKALVVLVTVLSILLVALVVPFVARTGDLNSEIEQLEQDLAVANAKAAMAGQEIAAAQRAAGEDIALLNAQVNTLTGQINDLRARLAEAEAQAQQERSRLAELNASLTTLSSAADQSAALVTDLTGKLESSQDALVQQKTRVIQLSDRNNELDSQLESLTRQVRRFRENMQAMEEANARYERLLAQLPEEQRSALLSGEGAQGTSVQPATPIAGQVTAVDQAPGDLTLVQVNVGREDGVEPNMKFLVYRDETLLARLKINTVDTAAAAGELELVQGQVQAGDRVYAGPF